MFFNYITLFTALLISSVAIFYSVAGLATIFAASALSVIVMGTSLEVGKLVVAVWLHRNWNRAVWWLKTYLTIAVIILMFITSMGIFGYLSKSHVEQTAASTEGTATITRIETDIARQQATIARSEEKISKYENDGSGADSSIQTQIDREQERIAGAYERIQPQIDRQLELIASEEAKITEQLMPHKQRIADINGLLDELRGYNATGEIKKAQGLIGAAQDGQYGPKTAAKFEQFTRDQEAKREEVQQTIDQIITADNPAIIAARNNIDQLNTTVTSEIAESNKLIDRLRSQLGQTTEQNIGELIEAEQQKIIAADNEIDKLTEEKFVLETNQRKMEAEVGPIKYIAEFVYGDEADTNILETAVRWVILIIIIVFDPLAVLLLIAAQHSFDESRKEKRAQKNIKHTKDVTDPAQSSAEQPLYETPIREDVDDNIKELIELYSSPDMTAFFRPHDEHADANQEDIIGSPIGSPMISTQETLEQEFTEIPRDLLVEYDIDEPNPSITDVEQLTTSQTDNEENENFSVTENNTDIVKMLHELKENHTRDMAEAREMQQHVLDELSKRKQILNDLRNKKSS